MRSLLPGVIVISGILLITYTEVPYWTFIFAILLALAIKPKRIKKKKAVKKENAPIKNKISNRLSSDKEILSTPIDKLSWREFERLIYLYYKHLGRNPVMTKDGADGGIDLVYTEPKTHEKVAVQIKHHKNPIGVSVIRETDNAARRNYKIYLSEIITSGRFTQDALREVDNNKGMEARSGYWVNSKIVPWMKKASREKT